MTGVVGKSARDNAPFLAQAQPFLNYFTQKYATARPISSSNALPSSARQLEPVVIKDLMALTDEECQALSDQYYSEQAVATFVTEHLPSNDAGGEPLLALTEQLNGFLELNHPIA
jgi:hypothetical protein